jgi:hypothetical protein
MESFPGEATKLNVFLIRYEDLAAGTALLEEIEDLHQSTVLENRVGSSERDGENIKLSWLEKQLLKRAVSLLAKETGYKW